MIEEWKLPENLERRGAQELVEVSFPDRTIELVVMPYDTETLVEYRGRMVREQIVRGAFDGINARPRRVKVNRDHDARRSIGTAVAFYPSREEGLVAKVRISKTELGDETLVLADDGVLDVSAAFAPYPGHEEWRTRDSRRITKAWLGHIAMTPDPAYDDARVLAVRRAAEHLERSPGPTPNLDAWRRLEHEERYADLQRRYARPS
jgi:HK97 family phage prohead protease